METEKRTLHLKGGLLHRSKKGKHGGKNTEARRLESGESESVEEGGKRTKEK